MSERSERTSATADELATVTRLLGRVPRGRFDVVVRKGGEPVVIRNDPLLDDGTPMPTRYWLVDANLCDKVARLEAAGGVRRAEAAVDAGDLADAHRRVAQRRRSGLAPDERVGAGVSGRRRDRRRKER